MKPLCGKVYLVGAGPGDPDLITIAGLRCLQRAEVVLYDRLVNPVLLDETPAHAELVYVGKAPQHHALTQDEINCRLIEYALQGKTVVRLKGGDPFVFGRGGEEAEACAAAGIECVLVPGISSALAVPARAGIPLTHRDYAGTFAVVTGQGADSWVRATNWSALAQIDTLVILMGVAQLPQIAETLLENGKPDITLVAIIERGTLPDERVTIAPLRCIAEVAAAARVVSPAVIVVGAVVELREVLGRNALVGNGRYAERGYNTSLTTKPRQTRALEV